MMENDQKITKNDPETVVHLHRQDGPQFRDSIEIGSPGKGGSMKVYFDASLPEDAEHRIRSTIRLKKLTNSLLQEG
jgi:DNA primase catalytic subunit